MKWRNRGHELDDFGKELASRFHEKQRKIYVFGAGLLGKEIVPTLEK